VDAIVAGRASVRSLLVNFDYRVPRFAKSTDSVTSGSAERMKDVDQIARAERLAPLVANEGVDVVVSNCVLNLVRDSEKRKVFSEIYSVLRRGGR
jgi:hypothetical protein